MGDGITYASGPGWNPISGCLHDCHSEQCWERCWARRMAKRQNGRNGYPAGAACFKPTEHPDKLGAPRKKRKPQVIPVAFMGDLFCGAFSWDYLDRIFQDMEEADWHTYLILTKRIDKAMAYIEHWLDTACWEKTGCPIYGDGDKLRPHIRIGTTVMTQEDADKRVPVLCTIPAETLWVSHEPAWGPVQLTRIPVSQWPHDPPGPPECGMFNALTGERWALQYGREVGRHRDPHINKIAQVFTGCESWPGGGLTYDLDWARIHRDARLQYGGAFYFKQAYVNGVLTEQPFLDGRQWLEEPEVSS